MTVRRHVIRASWVEGGLSLKGAAGQDVGVRYQ